MFPYSLKEIAHCLGTRVQGKGEEIMVSALSIDSRTITKGQLFLALSGENFDGHHFVPAAQAAGAAGAVVERILPAWPSDFPLLVVPDGLQALQKLAQNNRLQANIPMVGVTGSSGKTTTKDFIHAVLSSRGEVLKTKGNFNNEIGLPLTLLSLKPRHWAGVVEMGMRGMGEIEALCQIARPTAGVITNIGEAHLERLGTVANIAQAKGELLDHIPRDGFVFLHGESPYMQEQAKRCAGKVYYFGQENQWDLYPRDMTPENGGYRFLAVTPWGEMELFVPLPGKHNVTNALAAVGVGLAFGLTPVQIAEGLSSCLLSSMRLEVLEKGGIRIINDAYNANPHSMKAALQVLEDMAGNTGRLVAVLADMLEVGPRAEDAHRELGALAAEKGVSVLITVGPLAQWIAQGALEQGMPQKQVKHCATTQEAAEMLESQLQSGDVVLVKGSRAMHMEDVVQKISAPEGLLGQF